MEIQIFCSSFADRPHFVAYHISIALNERGRSDVIFKPVLDSIPEKKREEFAVSKIYEDSWVFQKKEAVPAAYELSIFLMGSFGCVGINCISIAN